MPKGNEKNPQRFTAVRIFIVYKKTTKLILPKTLFTKKSLCMIYQHITCHK